MDFWREVQTILLAFLPRLGGALVMFFAGLYFSKIAGKLIHRALEKRQPTPSAAKLIEDVVRWTIFAIGTIMAIQQFVDVTAFLAGLGILGFTVGFALQDVMKNFASGVILLVQQPFRVGDSVSVGEFDGTVYSIDLRSTEIKTFDGRVAILPNADVLNHAIINYSRSIQRRIEVLVGVAYGTDLKQARDVALDAVRVVPGFLEEPAAQVVFKEFGDSSVNMSVYLWVDTLQNGFLAARDAAIESINLAFEKNKIEIPFPTHTVFMQAENDES